MAGRVLPRSLAAFLCLLVSAAAMPPLASASAETASAPLPLVIPDGTGDVFPFGQTPPQGLPSVAVTQPFDIIEVGLQGEDEVGLEFYIKVVNFRGDTGTIIFSNEVFYEIRGDLEGTETSYALRWFLDPAGINEQPSGVEIADTEFCLFNGDEGDVPGPGGSGGCFEQRVAGFVDWDANKLSAYVSKSAMMGNEPMEDFPPSGALPLLTKGMRLANIAAGSQRFFPIPLGDSAPDDGPHPTPYVFQTDTANVKIKLGLDQGEIEIPKVDDPRGPGGGIGGLPATSPATGEASVTPGLTRLIPLKIENTNAAKRLISLSAVHQDPEAAGSWRLQIAPTVQVPGGGSRVVNLIVNASADIQHRQTTVVLVKGQSLGFADEVGAVRLTLVASVPPGPERKTLYFHSSYDAGDDPVQNAACDVFFCGEPKAWLNTLDTDDTATSDDGMEVPFYCCDNPQTLQFRFRFTLDTPLANDLVMDTSKPIEAVLQFHTAVDFPATISMDAYTTGTYRLLAASSSPQTISNTNPAHLSLLPLLDADRVGVDDDKIEVRLTIRTPAAGPGATSLAPQFQFVPGASEVSFPFVPDPNATNLAITLGPALITLTPLTDVQEFVNPGRTKLFYADVLNEGVEDDEALFEVLYDRQEWAITLQPGAHFRLPPGEGARIAILAQAPAEAQEGDAVNILINATSAKDPNVKAQLRFSAIVTKGVDIPDEAGLYEVDRESEDRVVKEPDGDTPGFEAVLALGVLVPAVAWLRRRSR